MTGKARALEYHIGTQHPNGALLDYRRRYVPGMRPSLYNEYIGLTSASLPVETPAEAPAALAAIGSFGSEESEPHLHSLTRILHCSPGITKTIRGHQFRAAACTGALYHIELYVVCGPIAGLDAGDYHYDPQHQTEPPGPKPTAPLDPRPRDRCSRRTDASVRALLI